MRRGMGFAGRRQSGRTWRSFSIGHEGSGPAVPRIVAFCTGAALVLVIGLGIYLWISPNESQSRRDLEFQARLKTQREMGRKMKDEIEKGRQLMEADRAASGARN